VIFLQFLALEHISTVNCDVMAGDRQNNLHMKLSALNVDFRSSSPDFLGSRRPAQTGIKDGCFPKSGYFTAIGLCSVKIVADIHRHAAYHNKQY